ncbi:dihydrodipicolinate synthase family protein [Streptomyces sp. NPDC050844]|uniref:dihydrodipicolinate synthase family protein n=1 Tax=Streptomyces sp. NPDC050844 TaxID=3155790 RepID=UPI0033F929D1
MTINTWNSTRPWRGIMVATTLPLRDDLSVDHDAYAEHVRWLLDNGCDGVVPNGSLGEYQTLTDEERARVVRTAVEAAGDAARVMPGVAAYGSGEARRWAEQAAEEGCGSVLLLPPNAYRADESAVRAHYAEVARAGVPVVAYNNPIDTKVDLTPDLLARLHQDGSVVAVKEFTGDVRRAYELAELAPELDLLIGADDVLLELAVAGAVGWIAGYPNAFPASCAELYHCAVSGDLAAAVPLYKSLHSLLRWDSKTEFVQSIKLSMDIVGRRGGPTRPPRFPLTGEIEEGVRAATEKAVAAGHK